MRKNLLLALFLLLPVQVFGGIHYVSPSGNAAWFQAGDINTPCSVATAMNNVQGGDTVYFLDGTYIASGGTYIQPGITPKAGRATSSDKPIILKSYNHLGAILTKGDPGGIIGTGKFIRNNYIIVDGFDIRGAGIMAYTTGSRFINNKFSIGGASGGGTNFGNMLFMEGCTNCVASNNLFSDNVRVNGTLNDSPIILYYDRGSIIEYNTYRNLLPSTDGPNGIFLKDAPGVDNNPTLVRYNFLNSCGIFVTVQNSTNLSNKGAYIYQNVFAGPRGFITLRPWIEYIKIYNNTFYNTEAGIWTWGSWSSGPFEIFGNIIHSSAANFKNYNDDSFLDSCSIYNHNRYPGRQFWDVQGTDSTSLAAWRQKPGRPDLNGSDDPLSFVNAGGSTPESYKVAGGAPAGGRGGNWPDAKGAYITGGEQIGHNFAKLSSPSDPVAPPSRPEDPPSPIMAPPGEVKNLRVIRH